MTTWKNKSPRERRIIISYLLISLPFMIAGMMASAFGYARFFSLGPDDPLSMLQLLSLTLVMLVALLVGLAIGGWVWLLFAKLIFGFSRTDIENMMASGPQIKIASRYNSWCLDIIFGPRENQN